MRKKDLAWEKMRECRLGFEHGLSIGTVGIFARNSVTIDCAIAARKALENGVPKVWVAIGAGFYRDPKRIETDLERWQNRQGRYKEMHVPKINDIKDLKTLIEEGVFQKAGDGKYEADYKGLDVSEMVDVHGQKKYEYDYKYKSRIEYVTFDEKNIYLEGKTVSLNELLKNLVFKEELLTDKVKEIVEARGYELSPVVMGWTNTEIYSFDMIEMGGDHVTPSYEIVEQREIGEKDVSEAVKTETRPTQSIFDIKRSAEAELGEKEASLSNKPELKVSLDGSER